MEDLTKVQREIVEEFAKKHEVSTEIALRFLLGRKWDRVRADELLTNYLAMRKQRSFEQLCVNDVLEELNTEKLTIPGSCAKDQSSLLMINAMKHEPGKYAWDDTLRLAFFMAETITSEVKAQENGISIICNMEGLTWEQSDYTFYRDTIQLFQNNFPCRVKNIFVIKPPWWISFLIEFVKPSMKPKMRERIHCEDDKAVLLEYFEKDALPVELGGSLEYSHDAFVKRQMAKASTAKITKLISTKPLEEELKAIEEELEEGDAPIVVNEELASELIDEREKAIKELDMAIKKRRSSLNNQRKPVDFTKLARSKAARLSVSLADSMPLPVGEAMDSIEEVPLVATKDSIEEAAPVPNITSQVVQSGLILEEEEEEELDVVGLPEEPAAISMEQPVQQEEMEPAVLEAIPEVPAGFLDLSDDDAENDEEINVVDDDKPAAIVVPEDNPMLN